jgi:hypothetical protein
MEPFTAGLSLVGLGLQLFGGLQQAKVSQQEAQVSSNIAQQEENINNQKQLQMQLEARRSNLQNYRNAQRARAQGISASVQGGTQYGSGMQGGLDNIFNTATENVQGTNQAMQVSQSILGYNNAISQD